MHQYGVGTGLTQHIAHAQQHTGGHVIQVLPLLHDVQVIIRLDVENLEHLIEHFAVLSGNAHKGTEVFRVCLECLDQRGHFDGFRTCPENKHYGFHTGR